MLEEEIIGALFGLYRIDIIGTNLATLSADQLWNELEPEVQEDITEYLKYTEI